MDDDAVGRRRGALPGDGVGLAGFDHEAGVVGQPVEQAAPQPILSSVRPPAGPSQRSVMSYFAPRVVVVLAEPWSPAV